MIFTHYVRRPRFFASQSARCDSSSNQVRSSGISSGGCGVFRTKKWSGYARVEEVMLLHRNCLNRLSTRMSYRMRHMGTMMADTATDVK